MDLQSRAVCVFDQLQYEYEPVWTSAIQLSLVRLETRM